MTILGKILVIVNLVFALVTGFLIVTVFVTRTNWRDGYDKLRKRYDIAEANARIFSEESKETKNTAETELKKVKADLETKEKQVVDLEKEKTDNRAEFKSVEQRISLANANTKALTEEISRRKQEIDNLKTAMGEKDQRVADLEQQNKQYRDNAISAEIQYKTEHERNLNLLQQNAELTKELERRPGVGGAAGAISTTSAKHPPQEDVQGVVLETDTKHGLITISIGTDAGVVKGNTLEVYRFKPRPEYVGTVTVIDANPHEAVARPITPLRAGPVQKDDIVASRIMTNRR
jgi:hypothetical protein